ncbi:MAG TPA: hypothetical protein VFL66_03215 [Gaiellaceae bacterium]|nr:hypothetical protein [Gaiellaceae bacterium]
MSEAVHPIAQRVSPGTLARRVAYPLRLVRARLARRIERTLLVGLGIAAGACVLALVDAGGVLIQDRNLERATAALAPSDRAVQVTWYGTVSTGRYAWSRIDEAVRPELETATGAEPIGTMLYHEASIGGHLVDLRAVDGAGRYVRLLSGRLPRPCVPSRCEVLRIAGSGPIPSAPGLRLVEVGRATMPVDAPFRDFLGRPPVDTAVVRGALSYHTPPQPPLVLADGVDGLSRSPLLSTFYRSYAWFVPVRPGSVHPWTVNAFRARIDRLRSDVGTGAGLASSDAFDVTAPTDELAAAAAQGRAAAHRLLLLGGEAAALLLAFTVLAASSLRRDVEAARRRLAWHGARGWQLALFSLGESGAVAAAATLAGWGAGIGLAALAASRAGVPVAATLRHSAAADAGIGVAVALAAAAALLLYATLRAPAARIGGARFTATDALALGALVAIGVGLARGQADAGSLAAGNGTGAFLLLLPALVAFVAAVVCARLLVPLLRGLERAGRRGPLPARLAALSLARNPGHATVAAAFLVVSLGLALFAAVYRSTLVAGERDQAAYAVPADYLLSEDLSQLVPVSHVPTPAGAIPVVRQSGDVSRLETSQGADVLGIPAGDWTRLAGWRSDFSSRPLARLAAAVRPELPPALRTVPLPAGARRLELGVAGRGYPIRLRAIVRLGNGDFATVLLGATGSRPGVLRARLPAGSAALLGFDVEQLPSGRGPAANGGTGLQPTANGRVRLGPLRAGGRTLPVDWSGWTGIGGVAPRGGGVLAYALTPDVDSVFRLRQPTDGRPVPAVVSPALARAAGKDGLLPFDVGGERIVLRVAGVASHFPGSTQPDFVAADEGTLSTALNAQLPGLGQANELWVNGPGAAFAKPPYDLLTVQSRAQVEARLRDDPLARGALLVLAGTALVALALALLGLALGLAADLRDESGELFDLETQGAEPALLRRHLRLRTLVLAAVGVAGGIATGAVLSALVLDLVRVTASAAAPEPPLALTLDWRIVGLGAAGFVAVGAAVLGAATRIGFRRRVAGRFREVGA